MEQQPDDPGLDEGVVVDHSEEGEMHDGDVIRSLVRELDLSGGTARIFRQAPGRAEFDYEGELPVDTFTLDTVKRVYGGGRYKVRLATAGGKYARQIKFSIDPRHRGEMDKINSAPDIQTMTSGNDNQLIAYLIKTSEDSRQQAMQQQQAMMTLLVSMMTEGNKTLASVMSAAFAGARPQQGEPASRLLEVMTPFLLSDRSRPAQSPLSEIVEGIKVVKQLSDDGKGSREDEEDDMLDKMMKIGAPILGALVNRGQRHPDAALPSPSPVVDDPIKAKVRSLAARLRMVTPILVRAAGRNADVVSYLDVMDSALDADDKAILVEFLRRDDWVSSMFDNNPDVVSNLGWFSNLRAVILDPSILDEDEGEAKEADPKKLPTPEQGQPRVVSGP